MKLKGGAANKVPNTSDFTYEHFPVVCPSCGGTGSIEDASDMVTFVPVKDERLRPAWTKLKIAVLILIILIIGGCATYFLYPRDVIIQINADKVKVVDYNFLTPSPWIEYTFDVNVTNHNFFAITLKHLTMQILYEQVIVSNQTLMKNYNVGMRTVKKRIVKMNASYDSNVALYIKKLCFKKRDYVAQLMESFAEYSYWMHAQDTQSKYDYFFTDCGSMIFPYPTKKGNVTTTTLSPSKPTTKIT